MTRAAIEVTLACDGKCRFCAQWGAESIERDTQSVAQQTRAAAAQGLAITFVGGEPTGREALAEWIALARAEGAPAVGIQTHARALADTSRAAALIDAGLTDAHVSIHGALAAVHDYHTDAPGSLDATLAGIAQLRRGGATIVVNTVVTRSNFRVLSQLPPRLRDWGVAAWCVSWPNAAGGAESAFDRLVPRLGLAAPFVLHAIDAARRAGLPAFVAGLPHCVLGPLASAALGAAPRAFAGEVCDRCAVRARCEGVDTRYLERFGADELHALGDVASLPGSTSDEQTRRLASMFVGVGTMAAPSSVEIADSPQRARARLPILGRPDPARQETRGRDAADGEALRGLFPKLFDDE